MTAGKMTIREVMRIMAKAAETSDGPELTIAKTDAILIKEYGYTPEDAQRAAAEAMDKWCLGSPEAASIARCTVAIRAQHR